MLLRFHILTLFVLLVLVGCGGPGGATTAERGTVTVARSWTDDQIQTAYALASYQNDTGRTFDVVMIECTAYGSGTPVAVNERAFFAHERGPIAPGFTGTVEVPLRLNGAHMDSAGCQITIAQ